MGLIILSATNFIIKWIITKVSFLWNYVNLNISHYLWLFINQLSFLSDNLAILKSWKFHKHYPTFLSLTLSISHLHVALMPLFAISAEYKCQERLLKPGAVVAQQRFRSTPIWSLLSNFPVDDQYFSWRARCKCMVGVETQIHSAVVFTCRLEACWQLWVGTFILHQKTLHFWWQTNSAPVKKWLEVSLTWKSGMSWSLVLDPDPGPSLLSICKPTLCFQHRG